MIVVLIEKPEDEDFPWERAGDDLVYSKTISLVEALTGYEFELVHMDQRRLLVKSESQDVVKPGDLRVIQNEGMPVHKNITEKGRLFIRFDIEFPKYKDIESHVTVCLQQ